MYLLPAVSTGQTVIVKPFPGYAFRASCSHRGGRQRAWAIQYPSACHLPTRAGSFPRPVMATSTPPKLRRGVLLRTGFAESCKAARRLVCPLRAIG